MTISNNLTDHESKDFANTYRLFAILHHQGDTASGHYHAEVLNLHDKQWYVCNDHIVQMRTTPPSNVSNTAYILLYYRKKG